MDPTPVMDEPGRPRPEPRLGPALAGAAIAALLLAGPLGAKQDTSAASPASGKAGSSRPGEAHPRTLPPEVRQAIRLARGGKPNDGIARMNAYARRSTDPRELASLAREIASRGPLRLALPLGRRARELLPDDEAITLLQGGLLIRARLADRAVTLLSGYLDAHPGSPLVLYTLARAHAGNLSVQQAVDTLHRALDAGLDRERGLKFLGDLYFEELQLDQAQKAYEELRKLRGPRVPILEKLGTMHALAGRRDEAIRLFEQVEAADPNRAETWYQHGALFVREGELEKARDLLRKAVTIDPSHAMAHYQLGRCLVALGDREAGMEHLRRYRELQDREHKRRPKGMEGGMAARVPRLDDEGDG